MTTTTRDAMARRVTAMRNEGASFAEIAEETGTTQNAVRRAIGYRAPGTFPVRIVRRVEYTRPS